MNCCSAFADASIVRNTGLPSSSISSRSSLSTSYLVCFFSFPTDPVGIILTFAIPFIPIVISSVALAIKRLHDRNKSGWWLLVFYLLPGVIDNIGMYTAVQLVFHLASLALSIWALVELGFLRGTSGSNKYGRLRLRRFALAPGKIWDISQCPFAGQSGSVLKPRSRQGRCYFLL